MGALCLCTGTWRGQNTPTNLTARIDTFSPFLMQFDSDSIKEAQKSTKTAL